MNVYVTNPHGFCMGVVNAIKVAEKTKFDNPNRPVAILGMLVHNETVVQQLQEKGIFTLHDPSKSHKELLNEVSANTIIIFTAHGHDKQLEQIAQQRNITYVDATCPRVKRNHRLIIDNLNQGKQVVYIGKKGHPETISSLAIDKSIIFLDTKEKLDIKSLDLLKETFVINQTTLSFLELEEIHHYLKRIFVNLTINPELCSETRLRQQAVINIPEHADLIYVVGSKYSSNTEKLFEVAKKSHPQALIYRIDTIKDIQHRDLANKKLVAIAAGASTPPELTNEVIDYLRNY